MGYAGMRKLKNGFPRSAFAPSVMSSGHIGPGRVVALTPFEGQPEDALHTYRAACRHRPKRERTSKEVESEITPVRALFRTVIKEPLLGYSRS